MSCREELEGERPGGEGFAPREVGVLEIQGQESRDFLQRMLTQDVSRLKDGDGARACLTDRLARIVGAMELLRTEAGYLAVTDPACCEPLARALRMYVFSSKVGIEDRSGSFTCLELLGPGIENYLLELGGTLPEEAPWSHRATRLGGLPVRLVRSPRLAAGGCSLLVRTEDSDQAFQALRRVGLPELAPDHARGHRVAAGTAVFGVDYDGSAMPTEVGLEDAVSYRKGCYVGQEILERMRSRGKRTRVLTCLELAQSPPQDADLTVHGQEPLGLLTSLAPAPGGRGVVGLVSLPYREIEEGTRFQVAGLEARIKEFS